MTSQLQVKDYEISKLTSQLQQSESEINKMNYEQLNKSMTSKKSIFKDQGTEKLTGAQED